MCFELPYRSMASGENVVDNRKMATMAGLEPATSGVTGRHSDQLSYMAIWNA